MPSQCGIDNGEVHFCLAMQKYCQGMNDHAKGLVALGIANINEGKIRLAGVVYKDKATSGGILLNFCPWCGQKIDAATKKEVE